jgi:hypothetical protein
MLVTDAVAILEEVLDFAADRDNLRGVTRIFL